MNDVKIIFHIISSTPLTDTAKRSEGAVAKPLGQGERSSHLPRDSGS